MLAAAVSMTACATNSRGVPYVSYVAPDVPSPDARGPLPAIAFCGVHPNDKNAAKKIAGIAASGVIATMGPCVPPPSDYTPMNPGKRYVDYYTYARLLVMNANIGRMKTIVYDPDVWSDDPAIRNAAITFWSPYKDWIFAFDMGDEVDPSIPGEWNTLVHRFNVVDTYITPALGVGGYVNHFGWALDKALTDIPTSKLMLSYDSYVRRDGVAAESLELALSYADRTAALICAVNALNHFGYTVPADQLRNDVRQHRNHGCDAVLVFGGAAPYLDDLTPDTRFGGFSLVDQDGNQTDLGVALLDGLK